MTKTLFFTGVTGFLGGTVLANLLHRFKEKNIDVHYRTLVRSREKADIVKEWAKARGFEHKVTPVLGSLSDRDTIIKEVSEAHYVVDTANCDDFQFAGYLTEGLTKAIANGIKPIVVHTSGANLLTDGSNGLSKSNKVYHDDNDQETASIPDDAPHRNVDLLLLNYAKEQGRDKLHLSIVAPPTIWGVGRGTGSFLSQQVPKLIQIALKHKQAYNVGKGLNIWSEINVVDLADLCGILITDDSNKNNGFFWSDGEEFEYREVGQAIQQGLIDSGFAKPGSHPLDTDPSDSNFDKLFYDNDTYDYRNIIGGNARNRAVKAKTQFGWKPRYSSRQQFFDFITNEVYLISRNLK